MAEDSFQAENFRGKLHNYAPRLTAFEYRFSHGQQAKHILLFIGGLGDGLATVAYVPELAKRIAPDWTLVQALLTSSYSGWGISSLAQDASEISQCVNYFRSQGCERIVLMGHSTGCQDCMEYVVGSSANSDSQRSEIDGVILQSPISDREAMLNVIGGESYARTCEMVQKMMQAGKGAEPMPSPLPRDVFGALCTAERWHSLTSPPPAHDGLDDYFSSDFDDARVRLTFGRWCSGAYIKHDDHTPPTPAVLTPPPLLILYGEADEFVPDSIDKRALVQRWTSAVQSAGGIVDTSNGGVLTGATHTLSGCSANIVTDMLDRISRFLEARNIG